MRLLPLRWRRLYASIVCLLLVPLVASAQTRPAERDVVIGFAHINDSHGRIFQPDDQRPNQGGYARLASVLERQRRQFTGDRLFLLHAGDVFSRGDALTESTHGAANVAIFNRLGFDVWTPGNGEFYLGIANLLARGAEFHGQVILGNVIERADNKPLFPSYAIFSVGEVRVGFIGLGYIHEQHPACWGLKMLDPVDVARQQVRRLKGKVDVVVALTHLGLGEDQRLARSVEGIDLIIGGHSHSTLPHGQVLKNPAGKSVLIAQAGDYVRYLGVVRMVVHHSPQGLGIDSTATLIALDGAVPQDPAMLQFIATLAPTTNGSH